LADGHRDPKNILLIHFGQLGDVVLALPAMRAVRERFPLARIATLTGMVAGEVVKMSGFADDVIAVDRVELRDGPKVAAIRKILRLARDIRSRDLDLVIDLHSLKETNILAWLSRAKHRLLADRGNRSYHSLGNFVPPPPAEDRSQHLSRTYMRVLAPLGMVENPAPVLVSPSELDRSFATDELFNGNKPPRVGFFPGAGHPSRRWPLERFAALARALEQDGYSPIAFLGPEELEMKEQVRSAFPEGTVIAAGLSIGQFIAAVGQVEVFVTNDTGPMHLAALAGTPILLVMDSRAPVTYLPLADRMEVVNTAHISDIRLEQVHSTARKLLENDPE
jgi:ADP-heptose:LPS heptosyltransferase